MRRPVCDLARPVGQFSERSRHARTRHGDVRRALYLVPLIAVRNPQLAGQDADDACRVVATTRRASVRFAILMLVALSTNWGTSIPVFAAQPAGCQQCGDQRRACMGELFGKNLPDRIRPLHQRVSAQMTNWGLNRPEDAMRISGLLLGSAILAAATPSRAQDVDWQKVDETFPRKP